PFSTTRCLRGISVNFPGRRVSRSWRQPVVQPHARDVLKIGCVVRYQRQVVNQGCRGDHQVGGRHDNSLLQQGTSHLPELLGTQRVEIDKLDLLQQVGNQG